MDKVVAQVLKHFDIRGLGPLPIVTGRRHGKRELLPGLCAVLGHTRGAEIGVRSGRFSSLFCDAIPGLTMLCIDPWFPVPHYSQERQDRHFNEAVERLKKYPGVQMIKKTSMDALPDVSDRSLDFVHIDGRHEFDYVMEDVMKWSHKVKHGGVVMLHDYHLNGVMYAVNAYTAAHHIDPWFILKDDQPTAFWVNP